MPQADRGLVKTFAAQRQQLNVVLKPLEDVEGSVYRFRAIWGRNAAVPAERRDYAVLRELAAELKRRAESLEAAVAEAEAAVTLPVAA